MLDSTLTHALMSKWPTHKTSFGQMDWNNWSCVHLTHESSGYKYWDIFDPRPINYFLARDYFDSVRWVGYRSQLDPHPKPFTFDSSNTVKLTERFFSVKYLHLCLHSSRDKHPAYMLDMPLIVKLWGHYKCQFTRTKSYSRKYYGLTIIARNVYELHVPLIIRVYIYERISLTAKF